MTAGLEKKQKELIAQIDEVIAKRDALEEKIRHSLDGSEDLLDHASVYVLKKHNAQLGEKLLQVANVRRQVQLLADDGDAELPPVPAKKKPPAKKKTAAKKIVAAKKKAVRKAKTARR